MKYASARALAAVTAGIAAGRQWPQLWWASIAAAVAALALARPSRGWSAYLLLAAAAFAWTVVRLPARPHSGLYDRGSFRGVVVEEPDDRKSGRAVVELASPDAGRVVVWLKEAPWRLRYGDLVEVIAPIRRFDFPRNPGVADLNSVMRDRGYVGQSSPKKEEIRLLGRNRGRFPVRLLVMPARRYIVSTVRKFLPGDEASVLVGLLVGGRQRLPRDLQEEFVDSGIVHILAVSGMNVSVVIAAVWLLLAVLGLRSWWRFGLSAAAAFVYVGLAGMSAPPLRAGLMAVLALLSDPLQKRFTPSSAVCTAGLGLLVWNPLTLFEAGAQLSFAATLAILAFGTLASDWLKQKGVDPRLRKWLLVPVAVSLAAAVGTAPLLLHHFGRVQLLGFAATLLVAPLVSFAMPLGLLAVILNLVSGSLAGLLFATLEAMARGIILVARLGGRLDWAVFEPGRLAWPWVLWLYGLMVLVLNRQRGWARTSFRVGLVGGLAVAVWLAVLQPRETRVTFLDPGKGDAVLFEDTLGHRVLFDAGIDRKGALRDYLRSRGIRRLDLAVVTHPDRDHYGGLLDLEERFRIDNLLVATRQSPETLYTSLLARLERQGTHIALAGSGTSVTGLGAGVRFLWPAGTTRALHEAGLMPTNDVSLVTALDVAGRRLLLAGDLDDPDVLVELCDSVWLLKSPHHGSKKGNPSRLFKAVQPELVVVMGRHPTPAGLEREFRGTAVRYVNTRRDGAAVLRFRAGKPSWSLPFAASRP